MFAGKDAREADLGLRNSVRLADVWGTDEPKSPEHREFDRLAAQVKFEKPGRKVVKRGGRAQRLYLGRRLGSGPINRLATTVPA